jgi:ubiquinone biosynthesis protein
MDRSSNRLSFAIVTAAVIIGSSLVVQSRGALAGGTYLGHIGFVVAGILGIGLAIGIVRSGRL